MYRVDKKQLLVVLQEIGMKKENLIDFIKKPFFIEFHCDVTEDTNYLIRKNQSFPFFYYLIKINFVRPQAINIKIVIDYFFSVWPANIPFPQHATTDHFKTASFRSSIFNHHSAVRCQFAWRFTPICDRFSYCKTLTRRPGKTTLVCHNIERFCQ